MMKIGVLALSMLCVHILSGQNIRTFESLLKTYPIGSRPDTSKLSTIEDPPSLLFDAMYLIKYDGSNTLYGRSIYSIALGVRADTIISINIYVPFDTTLHKEMERDLGKPELGWMGFAPGSDTTGVIWTRYWDLPTYSVGFKCTRYQYQIGDVKDDLLAISLLPRRRK
jgi:hypothetical protein